MSAELTANLGHENVDISLSEIDARTKNSGSNTQQNHVIGPFSVFNFKTSPQAFNTQEQSASLDDANTLDDIQTTPSVIDSLTAEESTQLQWADLFELDFENMLLTQQLASGSLPQDI